MAQVKGALQSFVGAFEGTSTVFSLSRFGTTATTSHYFSLSPAQAQAAIATLPGSGVGETNWADGLTKAYGTFDPRPGKPNLIVFASDGLPTEPGTDPEALAQAITVANAIKQAGTRIVTMGIGLDADGIHKLQLISGPLVDQGGSNVDVITSSFGNLANDAAILASQLCGGTVSISAYLEDTTTPAGAGLQFLIGEQVQGTDGNGQTLPQDLAP